MDWSDSNPARGWRFPGDGSSRGDPESLGSGLGAAGAPSLGDSLVEGSGDGLDFSLHLHDAANSRWGPGDEPAGPRLPGPGEVVLGFRIVRELGRGAFARVYLAEQLGLARRQVALKVAERAIGEESQLLARLQHAHIVPIHSVHEDPASGLFLMCMPYLGGANLAQVLEATGLDAGRGSASMTSGGSLVAALDQVGGPLPSSPHSRRSSTAGADGGEAVRRGAADEAKASPTRVRSALGRYWARLADWSSVAAPAEAEASPERSQPARRFLRHASFVEAAVWITARLAEGLEHAHARGLLHRDLKPSNILIAGDGTPMILDFNLAAEADFREADGGDRARLGGTLPYMSPEHLDAFHPRGTTAPEAVDERSDLYALGLILFEMVAGRHPFEDPPAGLALEATLDRMIADRRAGPPSVRSLNPAVSWGLESILRKCLDPDPRRRYATAAMLAEDLNALLEDRPLRYAPEPSLREMAGKWLRRHPRLTSSSSVAIVAAVLIVATGAVFAAARAHLQVAAAQLQRREFRAEFERCQVLLNTTAAGLRNGGEDNLTAGLALAGRALDRFEVDRRGAAWVVGPDAASLPWAERRSLIEEVSELLLLEARAAVIAARDGPPGPYAEALRRAIERLNLAQRFDPRPPSALFAERAAYLEALGRDAEAEADRRRAARVGRGSARDCALLGTALLAAGRPDVAELSLQEAVAADPSRFWSWFALGLCHYDQGRFGDAAADFAVATALDPESAWAHCNRGLALARDGRPAEARAAYDRSVALDPDLLMARVNRALTRLELGDPAGAASDLEHAARAGRRDPSLLAAWGEALAGLGDLEAAEARFAEAIAARPDDPALLVARGFARLDGDPAAARSDFEAALSLDPTAARARVGLATLDRRSAPERALEQLDRALEAEPELIEAVEVRALVAARLGRPSARLDAARLAGSPTAHRLYNAACALAILSETTDDPDAADEAVALLGRALERGFDPAEARDDPDLRPLAGRDDFRRLVGP